MGGRQIVAAAEGRGIWAVQTVSPGGAKESFAPPGLIKEDTLPPAYGAVAQPLSEEYIPLLSEEGCPRHQQMVPFRSRGRGGRSATILQNGFRNPIAERPPRLRPLRWLRNILLMAQPPLLPRRGLCPTYVTNIWATAPCARGYTLTPLRGSNS
jgi:hypothetical protein